ASLASLMPPPYCSASMASLSNMRLVPWLVVCGRLGGSGVALAVDECHLVLGRQRQLPELADVKRGGAGFFFARFPVEGRAGDLQRVRDVHLAGSGNRLEGELYVRLSGLVLVNDGCRDLRQRDGQLSVEHAAVEVGDKFAHVGGCGFRLVVHGG